MLITFCHLIVKTVMKTVPCSQKSLELRVYHHIGGHEKTNVMLPQEILLKQLKNIGMRSKRSNYKDLINLLKTIFCYWDSMPVALLSYFHVKLNWELSLLIKPVLHPRSLGMFPSNTSHRLPGKTHCLIIASANIDHHHLALSFKPR